MESSVKALQQVMRGLVVRGMKVAIEKAHNVASSFFLWGIDRGDEGANVIKNVNVGRIINGRDVAPLFIVQEDRKTMRITVALAGGVAMGELRKEGSGLIEHSVSIKGVNSGVSGWAQCEAILGSVGTIASVSVTHSGDVSEFIKAKLERIKVGAMSLNGSHQSIQDKGGGSGAYWDMKTLRSIVFDGDKDWEVVRVSEVPRMGFHM